MGEGYITINGVDYSVDGMTDEQREIAYKLRNIDVRLAEYASEVEILTIAGEQYASKLEELLKK